MCAVFLILKEKSALFDYIWLTDLFSEVAFLDKGDGGKLQFFFSENQVWMCLAH